MASFLTNPPLAAHTNEYVPQQPVNAMIQAEQYMQQRHEAGVAKVQAMVDNINSQPIAKDSVKQYLQNKLGAIRNGMSSTLNGDFADQRVVNQVGSMVNQVANDPIIEAGIQSTLAIRNGQQRMAEDAKKGNVNPDNIAYFQDAVNSYMNNDDITQAFRGEYSSPFDTNKLWMENFKQVHPQTRITEDAFRIGPDGKTVLTNEALQQLKTEGITPDQIQAINQLTFSDPRAAKQLQIEAAVRYKNYTPQQIAASLSQNYNSVVDQTNDQIKQMQLESATNNNANSIQIAQNVKQLRDRASQHLQEYQNMVGLLQQNPEAAKAAMYRAGKERQYIDAYAYQNTSSELKSNPLYEAQIKERDYQLKERDYALKLRKQAFDEQRATLKDAAEANKKAKAAQGGDTIDIPATVAETEGQQGASDFNLKKGKAFLDLTDARDRMINAVAATTDFKPPYKQGDDGRWEFNVGPDGYATLDEAANAHAKIWDAIYSNHYDATAKPIIQKFMSEIEPLERNYRNYETVDKRIKQQSSQIINNIKATPEVKALLKSDQSYTINYGSGSIIGAIAGSNQQSSLTLSSQDILDAAILKAKGVNSKDQIAVDARDRLKSKLTTPGASYGNLVEGTGVFDSRAKDAKDRINALASNFKTNDSFLQGSEAISKLYKDAQQATQTFEHSFVIGTDNDRRARTQEFLGLLGPTSELTNGKGQVNDFKKMLDPKDANLQLSWQSQADGSGYLIARSGSDEKRLKVSSQIMQNLPSYQPVSEFQQRFGQSLALTKNTTTDVANYSEKASSNTDGGRATAYTMSTPNFTVKYHVVGDGSGSQYYIRGWVMDKKGNTLLNNVPLSLPNAPVWGNKQQIVNMVDKVLNNDQYIQLILATNAGQ